LNKKDLFTLGIFLFITIIAVWNDFSIGEEVEDGQAIPSSFYDEGTNNSKKPDLDVQFVGHWILVIKNIGEIEITNITFSLEKVNGKLPDDISFDIVEDISISTWKRKEVYIKTIPRLGVNESVALIESNSKLCFINASEIYDYGNSGWLIIRCDQGIEKRVPYTFTPKHGVFPPIWGLIYVFLFCIIPLLLILAIIVLIRRRGRKIKVRPK